MSLAHNLILRCVGNHRNVWLALSRNFANGPSDFYKVLNVPKDATQRQIKSAYYQLSKKYHPDVAGRDTNAARKFVEIGEAYECLRDPDRRRAYDNQRSGSGGRYPGDNDFFRDYEFRNWQWQSRNGFQNPYHNKQFTQQEYERIWREFNRMRSQRETYDSRIHAQRQKVWEDYAKQRAERWQEFHQKWPNGPPGSYKWEFRWGKATGPQSDNMNRSWELFRRIMLIYFMSFFFVALLRVFFTDSSNTKKINDAQIKQMVEQKSEKEQIEDMMMRNPVQRTTQSQSEDSRNLSVPQYSTQPIHMHPPYYQQQSSDDMTGFSSYKPSG